MISSMGQCCQLAQLAIFIVSHAIVLVSDNIGVSSVFIGQIGKSEGPLMRLQSMKITAVHWSMTAMTGPRMTKLKQCIILISGQNKN